MTISSTNRKAGPYIGNGTASTFPFSFKVFQASDLEVVKLTVATSIETTLALTTDYTVTLNADQNSNAGGSITLVAGALASGYNLVITSDIANLQPTDLTNQGGFYPEVITTALDRATIQIQQLQEGLDRAAQLPITSAADADALVADIMRLADSADNIDTVATNISSVNTVATNISTVNTVAGNNANITTVAGISSNVTSVAGNSTNINSVAGNSTNINSVAGNISNINAVAGNSSNINTVATNASNVTTVATNIASVNSAATNMAAIIDAPTQAASAAASAAAAAASAASGMYSAVQDKSANYTVVSGDAGDLLRVTTTSGVITITLPLISNVSDGFKVAVVKWTADSNAVSIVRSGSDTINGATSASIGAQYTQTMFVADFETNQWFASTSGLGSTNVVIDAFNGTGSQTAFTLSGDAGTENNTYVYVSGVYQSKATYSLSGTTLTFSTAPPSGTGNIEVVWTQPLPVGTPSDGTVTPAKLSTGGLYWNTSGNVGIGTTSPSSYGIFATLGTVSNSASALGAADATVSTILNTNLAAVGNKATQSFNFIYGKSVVSGYYAAFNGAGDIGTGLLFGTQSTTAGGTVERMRIDQNGNIGIGTSTPAYKLTVQGQVAAGAVWASVYNSDATAASTGGYLGSAVGANNYFTLYQAVGGTTVLQNAGAGQLYLGTVQAQPVLFATSATERMRIDTSGNLQVGGTTVANTTGYVNSRTNTRAWARWTGSTVAIASSYNVSSVTRSSAGQYVVNFTTALADANYAPMMSCSGDVSYNGYGILTGLTSAPTTSSFAMWTKAYNGTAADTNVVQIAVFGN